MFVVLNRYNGNQTQVWGHNSLKINKKMEKINVSWLHGRWEYPAMTVIINTYFDYISIVQYDDDTKTGVYAEYFAHGKDAIRWMEGMLEIVDEYPEKSFADCIGIFSENF